MEGSRQIPAILRKPRASENRYISIVSSSQGSQDIPRMHTYLNRPIDIRKQYAQHRSSSHQVLHFERILVGVVGGLVVVEHEVDDVELTTGENNLEGRVPDASGGVRPEEVEVSGDVDCHEEKLGFEGDAGGALSRRESVSDLLPTTWRWNIHWMIASWR